MKKLLLLILPLMAIAVNSCSKDDPDYSYLEVMYGTDYITGWYLKTYIAACHTINRETGEETNETVDFVIYRDGNLDYIKIGTYGQLLHFKEFQLKNNCIVAEHPAPKPSNEPDVKYLRTLKLNFPLDRSIPFECTITDEPMTYNYTEILP